MKDLVSLFVNRYVASISLFGMILLFGAISYLGLGVELFPEINSPVVAVSTAYPGAGSEEVARQVSEPLEDALATLAGINNISSTSSEGISVIVAQFNASTDQDQAAIDVSQRIDTVIGTLPNDARAPVIQKFDPAEQPILNIALSAPGDSLVEVQRYAEDILQPRLQRVDGVADISVVGPVDREFQVLLDPDALERYGLSPDGVAQAIGASALDLPFGSIDVANGRLILTGRNTPETLESVERILVDSARGLRVRDLAVVRDTAADVNTYARLNGEPIVLMEVQKTSGSNSVAVSGGIEETLHGLELPTGYSATIVADTTAFTEATVEDTITELFLAIGAVAFVIMFFVGRLGTILGVVLAIPISIMGALIFFNFFGFSFNLMTLLAITVAVGLVVDDSIVVAENIERRRELGEGPKESVIKGTAEVSTAVLAATLALLSVFLPISFLPGIIGDFFANFGLSMAAMIAFSYIASIFFLPMLLAYIPNPLPPKWRDIPKAIGKLKGDITWTLNFWKYKRVWLLILIAMVVLAQRLPLNPPINFLAGFGIALLAVPLVLLVVGYLGRILVYSLGALFRTVYEFGTRATEITREAYAKSLRGALAQPWIVLGLALLLFGSVFYVGPQIGFNFVPPSDDGQIVVNVELPVGTNLDQSNALAAEVEALLAGDEVIDIMQTTVGAANEIGVSGPERSTLYIEMVSKAEREITTDEMVADLEERIGQLLSPYPEARLSVAAGDAGGGGPPDSSLYELTLASNDLSALQEREGDVRAYLERIGYLRNVSSTLEATVGERVFTLDDARLSGTGLSPVQIYQTLRTYSVGTEAAKVRADGEEFPIEVMVDPFYLRDEQALLSLPIFAPALETNLPLSEVGRFVTRAAPSTINRSAQTYSVDFTANIRPDGPPLLTVRNEIEEGIIAEGLVGDEVRIGQGASLDLVGDLARNGPIAFMLALLLTYLVIATQFNTFRFPIYLLLTVPLALVGVFWAFLFTDTSFDIISVLGIVMLIGLVVKNAILLLEVLMEELRSGSSRSLKDALVEAGRLRFRPILMTALTVIIISAPLLLGLGEGAEFRQPLGLVILAGVLTSSLLTFYVVPAAFYQFERKRFERNEETKPEDKRPDISGQTALSSD